MQSDSIKDGSKTNSERPATEVEGMQQRGSLDNWFRGKPDSANESAGDAATTAGDSTEKTGNPGDKETPTFRDGKPRD
jgi:hypothetical protein